jgi:lincosamide and streptogramin A transport system ATP-binding/permease protein
MASIVFDQVQFHYRDPFQDVFGGLDLTIETGWRTALVGRNGRGKTTLLRLVAGALEPTAGRLLVPVEARLFPGRPPDPARSTLEAVRSAIAPYDDWRREMAALAERGAADESAGLAALHAGSPLEAPAPSAAPDAAALARWAELAERFDAAGGWDVDARIERELALLGLEPSALERPFGSLSGGEQTRALVAALFLAPGVFALIDEPTNHLDLAGRERLMEYLAGKPGFLLASHDRALLDGCADHTIAIERSGVTCARGGYSTWKREHDRRQEQERRRRETLEREVATLRRASRDRREGAMKKEREKRGAGDKGFIGRRAAKQMRRALDIERRVERRIEERSTLLRDWEKERTLALQPSERSPEALLRVTELSLRLPSRVLFERVSFTVRRGERIVVVGSNGCGKTKLLDLVAGEALPGVFVVEGRATLAARARVARAHQVPCWREGSLRDRLREGAIDETRFRNVLGALGVEGDLFEHPLETLSQGQLKKVELARSFLDEQDLLVWDEPMNYLDAPSRERIEEAILAASPAALVVEHDRAFIDRIATEVVAIPARR